MREIKFRFFDKNGKKMYQAGVLDFDDKKVYMNGYISYTQSSFLLEEVELMQYTGLKDKDGVEIYEGDIVKINAHSYDFGFENDRIGEIRFIEGCFGFYIQLSEKEYLFNELATESGYGELDYYEVIGNIYENPELIEKEGKVNE